MTEIAIKARQYRIGRMHPCPDCGKPAHFMSQYCHSCSSKRACLRRGLNLKLPQHCIDCGILISPYAKRCARCNNRHHGEITRLEHHPNWKGGKWISTQGYVEIYLGNDVKALEHRIVWEKTHGKPIPKGHIIHHLNGIKTDNRPENLVCLNMRNHNTRSLLQVMQARIRELEQLHMNL